MQKIHAFVAGLALVTAPAHAACWSAQDTSAAEVRDLQTMLMVATLRCHAAHVDITGAYNAFIASAEPAIDSANDRIKAHFRTAGGPVIGQRDYDHFTTILANAYGAGATTPQDCDRAAAVALAAAQARTGENLVHLASETLFGSPVEACAPVMAAAAPRIERRAEPVLIRVEAPASAPVELAIAAPVPVQWAAGPMPAQPVAVASVEPAKAPVQLASAASAGAAPVAATH